MVDILILVIGAVVHELGHYVSFYICGYKPRIKFWLGGMVTYSKNRNKVLFGDLVTNLLFGIVIGAAVIRMFSSSNELLMLYFIMCSMDIAQLFYIIQLWSTKKIKLSENLGIIRSYIRGKEVRSDEIF